ncbi:hypothetical protein CO667_07955 [Rhizobium sp. L43]|nr:hypothetical protein CO667_07955 [Rhizobium sp. L43]
MGFSLVLFDWRRLGKIGGVINLSGSERRCCEVVGYPLRPADPRSSRGSRPVLRTPTRREIDSGMESPQAIDVGTSGSAQPISPPVGEMPGRAEGVPHASTPLPGLRQTKRPEGVTLPAFILKPEPIRRLRWCGPCGPLRPSGCRWRAAGRRSGRCCG